MQFNTEHVRKRIADLNVEIRMLQQRARHDGSRRLAQAIAERQSECVGYRLLLFSRRSQLRDSIVDLARWRDGNSRRRDDQTGAAASSAIQVSAVGA